MNDSLHQKNPGYRELITIPRKWFPLKTLDWYILREFLIKYCILMLVFVILFILGDVYRYISSFLDAHASPWEIVAFLLYKLPGNIRFVLPISMLLGCMWCMAAFGKNMEITAMRASGVSLFRCGVPVFCVGLIVTGVNVYFNEFLVPYTESKAELLLTVAADHRDAVYNLLAYRSPDGRRQWLFSTYITGNEQKGVTLRSYWSLPMIRSLAGKPGSTEFREKIKQIFPAKAQTFLAQPVAFQSEQLKKELENRKIDIQAGSVLYNPKHGVWSFRNGSFVSYDRKDEHDLSSSRGTSAIHKPVAFKELSLRLPERPRDIANSVKEKDDLSTWEILDLLRNNPKMPERVKCIYWTVFFYRISFPWACLIAVFLGIPLATKNERTGSMLAVISAVAVIVIYIVIAQTFLVLGKGGIIPSFIAGTIPTFAFILFGLWRVFCDKN